MPTAQDLQDFVNLREEPCAASAFWPTYAKSLAINVQIPVLNVVSCYAYLTFVIFLLLSLPIKVKLSIYLILFITFVKQFRNQTLKYQRAKIKKFLPTHLRKYYYFFDSHVVKLPQRQQSLYFVKKNNSTLQTDSIGRKVF